MANTGFLPPLGPATAQLQCNPSGWDKCVIAGWTIPGFVRVLSCSTHLKLDKKAKNGADGANPTTRGLDPQPLEVEITTFNDNDREALVNVLEEILPVPGVKPEAVSIDHPSLRAIRVNTVIIIGASALIPEGNTSIAKMKLFLHHWLPVREKPAQATPKGAPVRKIHNVRKKPAADNPRPTQQKGFGSPPARLGNGQ